MAVEDGIWIMHGVSPEDPDCLHSVKDLVSYVNEIGFLPLFQNEIPGFSVEERTDPAAWWSDDPEHDPWIWRETIARSGELLYGKFFAGRAGFVSKEWLPYFANFRRDGYDFDALWDDEKADMRQKKIMDLFGDTSEFESTPEYFSYEIKEKAGFSKGGEKNFEGVLTSLQMRFYLVAADFRQKLNKSGKAYGWHIAVYTTPEHLLGYHYVTGAYKEEPKDSARKIFARVIENFPEADARSLMKVLGYGESAKAPKKNKAKDPYPMNLIKALKIDSILDPKEGWLAKDFEKMGYPHVAFSPKGLSPDQMVGLEIAIGQMKKKERTVLHYRYEENLIFREVGEKTGKSAAWSSHIHSTALKKMRHAPVSRWIVYGYDGMHKIWQERIERTKEAWKKEGKTRQAYMLTQPLENLRSPGLSSAITYLKKAGIETIGELREEMMREDWTFGIHGVGYVAAEDLYNKMRKLGLM